MILCWHCFCCCPWRNRVFYTVFLFYNRTILLLNRFIPKPIMYLIFIGQVSIFQHNNVRSQNIRILSRNAYSSIGHVMLMRARRYLQALSVSNISIPVIRRICLPIVRQTTVRLRAEVLKRNCNKGSYFINHDIQWRSPSPTIKTIPCLNVLLYSRSFLRHSNHHTFVIHF